MGANRITRRRAITIMAATAAGLACPPLRAGDDRADYEWRGFAMGTDARIIFSGADREAVRSAAAMVTAEIERLENALSLFRSNSEIVRLNRDRILHAPTGDMSRALELALDIAGATDGLFDPTVQALWEAYVDWFMTAPDAGIPAQETIAPALAAVDWRKIRLTADAVRLGDNQRITLNGLGQGYVTDRVADLLRQRGFNHVLVDLGEQRALGARRDGKPWLISRQGIAGISLRDGALATSQGAGCILGADGAVHHLFDPRNGRSARHWQTVTVHHRSAAVADALSTALYIASADEMASLVSRFDGLAVWTTDRHGHERYWTSRPTIETAGVKKPA